MKQTISDRSGGGTNAVNVIKKLLYALWILVVIPSVVQAWGSASHTAEGIFILENIGLILPFVAELIARFPRDFLYGCVGADVFVGKGSRPKKRHSHNWEVALKLLERADTDQKKAFAYGYLAHLSSDVVAHNFFVPNALICGGLNGRLGHSYWEARAELGRSAELFSLALSISSSPHRENDLLMKRTARRAVVPFGLRKQIFLGGLRLSGRRGMREFLHFLPLPVDEKLMRELQALSQALVIDILRRLYASPVLRYDPVGSANIRLARELSGTGSSMRFMVPQSLREALRSLSGGSLGAGH